jgi:heme/copper-type cytochrome/quinol oxidase subunit 4
MLLKLSPLPGYIAIHQIIMQCFPAGVLWTAAFSQILVSFVLYLFYHSRKKNSHWQLFFFFILAKNSLYFFPFSLLML